MTEERPLLRVLNPFDPARAWLLGLIVILSIWQFSDMSNFMGTMPGLAVALLIVVRRRVSVRDTFRLRPFRPADLVFPVCLSLSLGSAETLILEAIDFATRGRFGQWAESISPEIPADTHDPGPARRYHRRVGISDGHGADAYRRLRER